MPRSCFISYASEDHAFAEQLHADLLANDCEPWFAPESLRMGDRFQEGIEEAIGQYDKVIVIVSEASLKSRWVEREVLAARDREDTEKRAVLIPIKIDDAIAKPKQPWAAEFQRIRHIGDFTKWEDPAAYQRALARLLRDLKTERPKPSASGKRLPQDQLSRNRRQMIARVRHDWIEGVLNQSLYQVARIDLGLEDRPDLLDRPLTLLVQESQQAARMLPARTRIVTVFDEHADAGGLLILGAPGSGKTTLLLELASELLDRADEDETHLIPVVFNLSSWAVRRAPLAEWFVDELRQRYTVPLKVAEQWVVDEQILPLLDGLDEVAAKHQQTCVERINEFRTQRFLPMVVCSRFREYESLSERLQLPAAIAIQPLTEEETQEYLAGGGERLAGIRDALARDPTLRELLDSPLMLSVAMLSYRDRAVEKTTGESLEIRRQHLWARYVESMLQRRTKETRYTGEQTLRWLKWLAASMSRLDQSVFELESLTPWSLTPWSTRQYDDTLFLWVPTLFFGLLVALFAALFAWVGALLIGPFSGKPAFFLRWSWPSWSDLSVGFAGGMFGGLFAMMVSAMLLSLPIRLISIRVAPNHGTWRSGRIAISLGLFLGLVAGLFAALFNELVAVPIVGPFSCLFSGLVAGLSLGMVGLVEKRVAFFAEHWCMRFVLWRYNYAPFQYVRFLDYAAERIFLRKVGGGYIFIHRELLEYFASLNESGQSGHESRSSK